jgi:hypothetical protein
VMRPLADGASANRSPVPAGLNVIRPGGNSLGSQEFPPGRIDSVVREFWPVSPCGPCWGRRSGRRRSAGRTPG